MNIGTQQFWEHKYNSSNTFWDIGHISTPLKTYIDQLENRALKILVPGAGNSYEAEYLFRKGFKHVYVLDFARPPLLNFKKRVPDFPDAQLLHQDFFTLSMSFDLILEQAFFCALPPKSRPEYARKMQQLLSPAGKLAGLLFDFPLSDEGPPFGGSKEEYLEHFSPHFDILTMERCYNSIKPRSGRELFFILRPKK
ncbi:methyltransferase domain-containing protein [Sinomicrobium weinanense]|uniref:Methyltransferase domain-containing protein n=1 Tax=Sinomicrobium weinanense TaxID=2842200 RepID=A0A926JTG0_9FLAO|nr:methyltransferase domain-containing protein [Sinomicrobium weinanense]MBC9796932.1 methyltransferase domain-containing protein [Sinomicrobium weinanense]MBU3124934.1 methyltransferase domain-containing protein [Sinomicrobium weinanense]